MSGDLNPSNIRTSFLPISLPQHKNSNHLLDDSQYSEDLIEHDEFLSANDDSNHPDIDTEEANFDFIRRLHSGSLNPFSDLETQDIDSIFNQYGLTELENRARDISSGRRFTELGGNYYRTYEYDPDINGLYLRMENGSYVYNTGTGGNGRYIPGHDINPDGTVTRTYMLPASQAPSVSNLSRQEAIRHLSLIENEDGTFRREGFVGTYKVRDDGTVFYGGGYHPNCSDQIDLPAQTYINGRWYEGDVRPGSIPFSNDDNQDFMHYHYELYMEGYFFEYQLCPPTQQSPATSPIIAGNRTGVVYGDPIFESNGGRYEVRGEAGKIYNLLSDRDIQINARFVPSGTVETNLGDFGITIRNHQLEYREGGEVFLNGLRLESGMEAVLENGETITWNGHALTIQTNEYREIRITPNRIEVRTAELGVFQDCIMPHGLLGQAFDVSGLARNGTGIQGEGAIQGNYRQYEVSALFSNSFIHNRNAHNPASVQAANNNRVIFQHNPALLLQNNIRYSPSPITLQELLRLNLGDEASFIHSILNDRDLQIYANIQPSSTRTTQPPRATVVSYFLRIRSNMIEYRVGSTPIINGRRVTNMRIVSGIHEEIRWDGSNLIVLTSRYIIRVTPDRIQILTGFSGAFRNDLIPYELP